MTLRISLRWVALGAAISEALVVLCNARMFSLSWFRLSIVQLPSATLASFFFVIYWFAHEAQDRRRIRPLALVSAASLGLTQAMVVTAVLFAGRMAISPPFFWFETLYKLSLIAFLVTISTAGLLAANRRLRTVAHLAALAAGAMLFVDFYTNVRPIVVAVQSVAAFFHNTEGVSIPTPEVLGRLWRCFDV